MIVAEFVGDIDVHKLSRSLAKKNSEAKNLRLRIKIAEATISALLTTVARLEEELKAARKRRRRR